MRANKIVPYEEEEHFALMDWVLLNPFIRDVFIHIPNGGSRSKKRIVANDSKTKYVSLEGKKLKRMGVKKGVSDFFLPIPNKHYHGLWIELKRTIGSTATKEQEDWQSLMLDRGYAAFFCYGAEHAIRVIQGYLANIE